MSAPVSGQETSASRHPRAPNLYECDYAHDRRQHRHRCQGCRKIINAGERVVMYRVSAGTSRAIHVACSDLDTRVLQDKGVVVTFRDLAQLHCDEYARMLGFRIPESPKARL